jgi:hypothetical protein
LTNVTNSRSIEPSKLSGWLIDIWFDLQKILAFKLVLFNRRIKELIQFIVCTQCSSSFYNPTRQGITRVKSSVEELETGRADIILSPFVVTVVDLDIAAYSMPIADLKYESFLLFLVFNKNSLNFFMSNWS